MNSEDEINLLRKKLKKAHKKSRSCNDKYYHRAEKIRKIIDKKLKKLNKK